MANKGTSKNLLDRNIIVQIVVKWILSESSFNALTSTAGCTRFDKELFSMFRQTRKNPVFGLPLNPE